MVGGWPGFPPLIYDLGYNPVLVALRTVSLAGFTNRPSGDRVAEREARERPELNEGRAQGGLTYSPSYTYTKWGSILKTGGSWPLGVVWNVRTA